MSLLSLCKFCLRQRKVNFEPWKPVWVRNKTYGKQSAANVETTTVDKLVYRHTKAFHVAAVMAAFAAMSGFLYSTALTFQSVGQQMLEREKENLSPNESKKAGRFTVDLFKYKEGKYHRIFANSFFFIALLPALALIYIPPRYVRAVVMLKDGKNVCLQSYAPFGRSKYATLPLSKLSSVQPYQSGKASFIKPVDRYIPFYLSGTGEVFDAPKLEIILSKKHD